MTRQQKREWLAQQPEESTAEERAAFEEVERERLRVAFYEREAKEFARIKEAKLQAAVKKYVKRCGPVNQPKPQPPEGT
jgi:hypothetical protein